jgi:hypothetical protein
MEDITTHHFWLQIGDWRITATPTTLAIGAVALLLLVGLVAVVAWGVVASQRDPES